MKAEITKKESAVVIAIDGRLDTVNAKEFEATIAHLLQEKNIEIVVDCEKMVYISSSGLRTFMLLLKASKANNCTLVLEKMSAEIKTVFDMTGFSNLFVIV
ncbi:MAG: STAS domain-containing protein [Phocaeicola sp.]